MNNSFQFVEIDLIPAVGLSTTLTTSQHENFVIISSLWKRFNAEFHKIGNRPPSGKDWEKYGITYSQNHEYCYLAAIRYMDNMLAPSSMVRKNIMPGRYACITHTGKLSSLKSTIYAIYKKLLPQRNISAESEEKAGLIHFEKYDNRFHWNRPDSLIEIYVPLETGKMRESFAQYSNVR
jgi:predicted transcriptional regulator YdeE